MGRIEDSGMKMASFYVATGVFCLIFMVILFVPGPSLGAPPAPEGSKTLSKSNLLALLDCVTRPDQPLAVRAESYGGDEFRVRYVYPVVPGREANLLNMLAPANWAALMLYHRDVRYAALFEVGFDGPSSKQTFVLLDGANLEKEGDGWAVKNILSGGASTWPDLVDHVDRISKQPMVNIRRADVTRTNAACEFPTTGTTFSAVSITGDRSNWKFKDGVSDGIPMKSHSGPFKNSDLKRVPSRQVYMNVYGY
jgi:hypothetical protein